MGGCASVSASASLEKVAPAAPPREGGGGKSSKRLAVEKKAGVSSKKLAAAKAAPKARYNFRTIKDNYETLDEVADALHEAGLESSNLICAIDFTKSNQVRRGCTRVGRVTAGTRCVYVCCRPAPLL